MYRYQNSTRMYTQNVANEFTTTPLEGNCFQRLGGHRKPGRRISAEFTNLDLNWVYCKKPYGMNCNCGYC
jgi:hypothetical protein